MITEEKLNRIYEGIINDKELTTKELNSYGFNSKDITKLIEQGIISRIKRGYYKLIDIERLYSYGKNLIKEKEHTEAQKCFEKVVELEPTHFNSNFGLFFECIYEDNYQEVYKYFNNITSTTNKFYHTDYNTYLYLLNFITDMPEKYKRCTMSLTKEQLLIDEKDIRYKDTEKNNEIRIAISQRKFVYAYKLLQELINEKGYKTRQDIIISSLLYDVINSENNDKTQILNCVKEKDYETIKDILTKKESRVGLSYKEKLIIKLISDIRFTKATFIIPKITIEETSLIHDAIYGCNYALALKLSKEYNEKHNISNEEDSVYILLNEICNEIEELKNKKALYKNKYNVEELEKSEKVTLNDVLNKLMESNLEESLRIIKIYLKGINKSEYEFLITRLIKLSLLQNDFAFITPMTTLTFISRNNYSFDVSTFIQDFYVTLTENKLEESEIYLDIIRTANNMNLSSTNIDNLEKVLNMYKSKNNSVKNQENKTNEKEEIKTKQVTHTKNNTETINSEKEFLDHKYQEILKDKGIIILKPMNKNRRRIIHKLVETYPNMDSFSIGKDTNRRIVLKYKKPNSEYININEEIDLGKIAYINKNYNLCIDHYKNILGINNPKAFIYSKIGLAYMMAKQKQKAIDYLTVALELSKQENKDYPLEDLLANLKDLVLPKDRKPYFKMTEEDFVSDIDNYYGIDDIEEILGYIIERNLDIETACKELKIDEEKTNLIKLIIAKEYYSNGNLKKGDDFLKNVEQNKNKSRVVLELLDKIRKNKKFYQHLEKNKNLNLTLTLKP